MKIAGRGKDRMKKKGMMVSNKNMLRLFQQWTSGLPQVLKSKLIVYNGWVTPIWVRIVPPRGILT